MNFRSFGGPTVVLPYGGLTFLTDPTFDEPGDYPIGDRKLTKTAPPSGRPEPADVVLLSHDQHPDNLDDRGRAYVATVPLTLITPSGAERLGGTARGLEPWESTQVGPLTVTAVPALHGPEWAARLTGDVTGFVLTGDGLPTVYVSGDNASLDVVREVADRFPEVDVAMLFAGAARTGLIDGFLTITAREAARAVRILGARHVVPVHYEMWGHFTESASDVADAFAEAGLTDRVTLLAPGESTTVRSAV